MPLSPEAAVGPKLRRIALTGWLQRLTFFGITEQTSRDSDRKVCIGRHHNPRDVFMREGRIKENSPAVLARIKAGRNIFGQKEISFLKRLHHGNKCGGAVLVLTS